MAVSYVGVGAQGASNTNGATVTYNWPSGYTPVFGDVAFVFQTGWWTQPSSGSPPDGPAPSGYTFAYKYSRDASSTLCYASSWYYKLLDGTESAPQVTLTSTYASATNLVNGFVVILRQVNMDDIFDGSAVQVSSGSASSLSISTFNTTTNDTLSVSGIGQGISGGLATTGGSTWTYRATGTSYDTTVGGDSSAGLATKFTATAGGAGFHGWQNSAANSAGWAGVILKVNSAFVADAPTSLTSSSKTGSAVSLYWTAPVNDGGQPLSNYTVEWGTDNVNWPNSTNTGSGTAASVGSPFTVTGLSPNTQYYFRVAAVNSVGTSAYSSSIAVTTDTTPGAPTALTSSSKTGSAVSLYWTAPASDGGEAISNYTVQWGTDNVNWPNSINTGSGTAASVGSPFAITGLTSNTQYYFRVAAINSVGTGSYSTSIAVTTDTTPGAPTSLAVASFTTATVSLYWTAPASDGGEAISNYSVQWGTDNSTWPNSTTTGSGTAPTLGSPFAVTGLATGTLYYFRVAATNSVGTGSYSTSISALTSGFCTPGILNTF